MLFYIKHEIIGDDYATKLDADPNSLTHESIDLQLPEVQVDLPADWWDRTCDASMLIGVYKHGFEKYSQMRLDEHLCFLSLCGPPDAQDILAEEQQQQENENEPNEEGDAATDAPTTNKQPSKESQETGGYKRFPTVSELNNR
jgi:hypothetical protein